MNELKNRGVEDVLIAVVDGLKGFPEAITAVFPQTQVQTCVVHLIRNSLDFVSYKDRKARGGAEADLPGQRRRRRAKRTEHLRRRPMGPTQQSPKMSPREWAMAKAQFAIIFEGRFEVTKPAFTRKFPHRRNRTEASLSRVGPDAERMENTAPRMGHGESAIRGHIRGQVQVGVTKPEILTVSFWVDGIHVRARLEVALRMKRAHRDAAEIKRVQQLADTALMHADAKVRGDAVTQIGTAPARHPVCLAVRAALNPLRHLGPLLGQDAGPNSAGCAPRRRLKKAWSLRFISTFRHDRQSVDFSCFSHAAANCIPGSCWRTSFA
jgi:hypothetical protein